MPSKDGSRKVSRNAEKKGGENGEKGGMKKCCSPFGRGLKNKATTK